MRVLVTGFDPFGGAAANPSGEIAVRLAERPLPSPLAADVAVEALVLPTIYAAAAARVRDRLAASRPDLVVMFGLAASSSAYRLERFALNVADSPEPDNSGAILTGCAVIDTAPSAYRTGLDLDAIAQRTAELTAHRPVVSNHAGAFVCNSTYFTALHAIAASGARGHAVFVHVPWALPVAEPGALARAPLDVHVETAQAVVQAIVEAAGAGASAA